MSHHTWGFLPGCVSAANEASLFPYLWADSRTLLLGVPLPHLRNLPHSQTLLAAPWAVAELANHWPRVARLPIQEKSIEWPAKGTVTGGLGQ